MENSKIRLMVVTDGIPAEDIVDMGFEYAPTLGKAVSLLHQRLPKANVAAGLNSKVIVSLRGGA